MGETIEIKKEGETAAEGGGGGGVKKEELSITVVLKINLHCEGCAKKVRRAVGQFEGVEKVKTDCGSSTLTVIGKVDPAAVREAVEAKTKKKVVLISPQPKKDPAGAAIGDKKPEEKPADKKPEEKPAEKKPDQDRTENPKEAICSTVVLKIKLHCDGCAHKIKRVILKNVVGVNSVTTNLEKDIVTVIGTMDPEKLVDYLREKLKRHTEILPPPRTAEGGGKKNETGEEKKNKEEHRKGEKVEEKTGGGLMDSDPKTAAAASEVKKSEEKINKMEFQGYNPQTFYAMQMPMQPMYNQRYFNQDYGVSIQSLESTGYMAQYSNGPPPPPPTYINDQMFSDENPNACLVM